MEFALAGRLDASAAPELEIELLSALEASGKVTLDMAELSYISSAGLRVLLKGQKTAAAKGAA